MTISRAGGQKGSKRGKESGFAIAERIPAQGRDDEGVVAGVENSRHHAIMTGYVYMLASKKGGTIYTGVTNSLGRRVPEHKAGEGSRFTSRYGTLRLVWYEEHFDIRDAIEREKQIKRWRRAWKIELIEKDNPDWFELFRGTGW